MARALLHHLPTTFSRNGPLPMGFSRRRNRRARHRRIKHAPRRPRTAAARRRTCHTRTRNLRRPNRPRHPNLNHVSRMQVDPSAQSCCAGTRPPDLESPGGELRGCRPRRAVPNQRANTTRRRNELRLRVAERASRGNLRVHHRPVFRLDRSGRKGCRDTPRTSHHRGGARRGSAQVRCVFLRTRRHRRNGLPESHAGELVSQREPMRPPY